MRLSKKAIVILAILMGILPTIILAITPAHAESETEYLGIGKIIGMSRPSVLGGTDLSFSAVLSSSQPQMFQFNTTKDEVKIVGWTPDGKIVDYTNYLLTGEGLDPIGLKGVFIITWQGYYDHNSLRLMIMDSSSGNLSGRSF